MIFSALLVSINLLLLVLFLSNPQGKRKERSHEALGKCRKIAKGGKVTILCFKNEKAYTSDFLAV